jgi:hypothetical protein
MSKLQAQAEAPAPPQQISNFEAKWWQALPPATEFFSKLVDWAPASVSIQLKNLAKPGFDSFKLIDRQVFNTSRQAFL